jgi:hypothetical protein
MSLSLWNRASLGTESKFLPKIYKATVDFRRPMSCLLNDGPEGKDVINGLMRGSESCMSPSSEVSTLKLTREASYGEL